MPLFRVAVRYYPGLGIPAHHNRVQGQGGGAAVSKLNVEKMLESLRNSSEHWRGAFESGGAPWQEGYAEALEYVVSDIEEGFWDE